MSASSTGTVQPRPPSPSLISKLTPEITADGVVPLGYPHPNVSFHLVDEQGAIIDEPGRVGELYIGGPQLMTGYWGAPDLTSAVLRTDVVPGETVYRSGDLVYRDKQGAYVYVDRADRVIKRSGVSYLACRDRARRFEALDGVSAVPPASSSTTTAGLGIVAFRGCFEAAGDWFAISSKLPETCCRTRCCPTGSR